MIVSHMTNKNIFIFIFIIEIWLTYNTILVSGVYNMMIHYELLLWHHQKQVDRLLLNFQVIFGMI